jgi:1-acyl-sn-glycerol-3-phosphate acyltransferase
MQYLGTFAVNRARLEKNTLRSAKVVLESGGLWHLGIFPEGSRKEGGDLKQLKAGAAFLAVRNQVPVIPVGVATHPKESKKQHCHVQVGPLLTPEAGESVDAFSERMLQTLTALKTEAATRLR